MMDVGLYLPSSSRILSLTLFPLPITQPQAKRVVFYIDRANTPLVTYDKVYKHLICLCSPDDFPRD